jgi:LCP family protein required for cell wall assembly
VLAVVVIGGVTFASKILNSFRDKNTSLGDVIGGIRNPRGMFPNQDRLTILLVGQDYNHDNRGYISSKNTRADTIMLLSVDLDKKQTRACSIPRDTYVLAPDGKTGKINATYSRGGIDLLKGTILTLLGVQIDHHVIIKADAVREIVDAVGGVEVETIDEMHYDDNWGGLHVHLPKGPQRVDGKGAEGFIRFREVNRFKVDAEGNKTPIKVVHSKEEGDFRRMARQQQLIRALMSAASSPSNVMKASSIIDTGFSQIDTDLSRVQCLALASLLKGTSGQSMVSGTVPGKDAKKNGVYFYEIDQEKANATVDWLIRWDDKAMRKLIRIGIKNGTKISGVAKTLAEQLVKEGYDASSLGNAPPAVMTTILFDKASYESAAKEVQRMLGAPSVQKNPKPSLNGPEIQVVIGEDTARKIKPPTAASAE